jgi:exonuclease SbcD
MAMRIFLASDFHLGMKFAGYPDAQTELVEERFQCLQRVVRDAGERRSDLLVVAGDLFDRVSVARRDVQRAAETLRGFTGRLAAVLPGNHDFLSSGEDLWRTFRDASGGSVLVLEQARPYPLAHYDLDACLYPGPCTSKHSKRNAIGWVRGAPREPAGRFRIGVAHGSLEGVSPDFTGDYYPMTRAELGEAGLDLWLLGHTHVRFPEAPGRADRVFFPGTPEPDGFDCPQEGGAWFLDLGEDGGISAQPVRTGAFRFVDLDLVIRTAADLESLEKRFSGPEAKAVLARVRLSGRAPRELLVDVEQARGRMAGRLLHLDLRTDDLREEITAEAIDREFAEGSFPHALLRRLADAGDLEALEIAHGLIEESRR